MFNLTQKNLYTGAGPAIAIFTQTTDPFETYIFVTTNLYLNQFKDDEESYKQISQLSSNILVEVFRVSSQGDDIPYHTKDDSFIFQAQEVLYFHKEEEQENNNIL